MSKFSVNQQGAWALAILISGLTYTGVGAFLLKGRHNPSASDEAEHGHSDGGHTVHADDDEGADGEANNEHGGGEKKNDHHAADKSESHATGHEDAHASAHEAKEDHGAKGHGGEEKSQTHGKNEQSHQKSASHNSPHWSYEGDTGPERWGSLSADFALCETGMEQSPINLTRAIPIRGHQQLKVSYRPAKVKVFNNGHTIQAEYPAGSYIEVDDKRYELVQFHFHTPSEHHINGQSAPLEVHFVHKAKNGQLAVIGVMLQKGPRGATFASVLDHLPNGKDAAPHFVSFDAAKALPAKHDHYTYPGSLTTPPCSEGVLWMVMKDAGEVTTAQYQAFHDIFPVNARPIQPVQERMAH